MATSAFKKRMLALYSKDGMVTRFLSSFFRTPAENFHNTEEVEIDIERSEEDIATVIVDLKTGSRLNTFDGFVNKSFKPPVFDEAGVINAFDLLKRDPGVDPFTNVSFVASANRRAFKIVRLLENKVRRAVEQMAAQIFTTGVLVLQDKDGNDAFGLDYKPKPDHFTTVGTAWNLAGATPLKDIETMVDTIRDDGLTNATDLIFGQESWGYFIENEDVKELLDNRRMFLGQIAPGAEMRDGAKLMGNIHIGPYRLNMWVYTGRYKHPVTGVKTRYIPGDKVVVMDSEARLDLTFGSIPVIARPERSLPGMPTSINSTTGGFGVSILNWLEPSSKVLNVEVGTRPLTIPTDIDSFGCITTGVL